MADEKGPPASKNEALRASFPIYDSVSPRAEEEILSFWKENKIFEKSLEQRKNAKRYVFYDGPPFATGLPHYGHILASTVKDMVPRFWTMKGFRVDRRWGWDCHGLPIENLVEQELHISGRKEIEKIGIEKFNEIARSKVLSYSTEWEKTIDRIGRFVDFKNSYKTMSPAYMESVWWAFAELNKKGLVYKDSRISLFCPRCETPLSNFEIAMDNSYQDKEDDSVYVKFPLKQKPGTRQLASFLVWTTTPWTLPGNVALAVNPEVEYLTVELEDAPNEWLILAEERKRILGGKYKIINRMKGSALEGTEYDSLFSFDVLKSSDSACRAVAADFVSVEEGTGIVHIAPAFGEEDFNLRKIKNLPILDTLDDAGRFNDKFSEIDFLKGKTTEEAGQLVIEYLKVRGLLWKVEKIQHRYPICWRCETPLIYKVQPAWFIKISALKQKMLSLNEGIDWHPEHLKHGRFDKGIESAPDWNVSRSRYWGTPLPIWVCKKCEDIKIVSSLQELDKFDPTPTELVVMRHGQAMHNVKNLVNPVSPENDRKNILTEKGRKDAADAGENLKKEKIEVVVSSPSWRAHETARIVGEIIGVNEIETIPELYDIMMGGFEGKPISEFEKVFSSFEERFWKKPEGAENLRELRARVMKAVAQIRKKYAGKKVLLVSHGDSDWLIMAALAGIREKDYAGAKYLKPAEFHKTPLHNWPYNSEGELDLHLPYIDSIRLKCEKCTGEMERIPDVFDCWVESGSMPFAEKHYPFENKELFEKNFPADFISEYIAQTRGWFYTLHVIAAALFSKSAFKHVLTTGTILSEKGEKLSKSRKNFPDPQLILDNYGADALRFYLMSSPVMQAENINFSEKEVGDVKRRFLMILWNSYLYWKTYQAKNSKSQIKNPKLVINQWIIARWNEVLKEITERLEAYDIVAAARLLEHFIVEDISHWYIRRIREHMKSAHSVEAEECSQTLGFVLLELSKALAPFVPFIADGIYKGISGEKESVHLEDYPLTKASHLDTELIDKMNQVREIVSKVLEERQKAEIKIRQPLQKLQITNDKLQKEFLELIKGEINVKEITVGDKLELDTKITEKLKEEGLVREFIRQVQDFRKELKLKPQDKVLLLADGDKKTIKILEGQRALIEKEINVSDFKIGVRNNDAKEIEINGVKVFISIK